MAKHPVMIKAVASNRSLHENRGGAGSDLNKKSAKQLESVGGAAPTEAREGDQSRLDS